MDNFKHKSVRIGRFEQYFDNLIDFTTKTLKKTENVNKPKVAPSVSRVFLTPTQNCLES